MGSLVLNSALAQVCGPAGAWVGQPAIHGRLGWHVGRKKVSSKGELEAGCKVSTHLRL